MEELQSAMSQREFQAWLDYHRDYPIDDLHRIYRPATALASVMGGKADVVLDWLCPEPIPAGYSRADVNTMRAFGMQPPDKG